MEESNVRELRPGFALTASILGYVVGGLCVCGGLAEDDALAAIVLGGGIIAMSVLLHLRRNWARITLTVLLSVTIIGLLSVGGEESASDEELGGCLVLMVMSICAIVFSWLPSVNKWFSTAGRMALILTSTMCLIVGCGNSDNDSKSAAEKAALMGRTMFVGIVQANVEREGAGMMNVWPMTDREFATDDRDDISGRIYQSSARYFRDLLDCQTKGKAPYVNVDIGVLDVFADGKVGWIVAANVVDELSDNVPVLVSANIDVNVLKRLNEGDLNTVIPIGSACGRPRGVWGDEYVVVIRKGGSAQVIPAGKCTKNALRGYECWNGMNLTYLDVD